MHTKLRCHDWILRTFCYLLGEELDPDPGGCPEHKRTNVGGCAGCRPHNSWKIRHHRRIVQYRVQSRYHDVPGLTAHVRYLIDECGLTPTDVARLAGVYPQLISSLIYGSHNRRGVYVTIGNAKAILAVRPPAQPRPPEHVDATGTRRRLQAMNRAGNSWLEMAEELGWAQSAVLSWARPGRETVPNYAYEGVLLLYRKRCAEWPKPNNGVVTRARKRGYLPTFAFPGETIDDPTYDPLKRIESPTGLRRRLRALACHRHGPKAIAALTGEDPALIKRWMMGKPAPLYAHHMIAEVYERLSGRFGTERMIPFVARRNGWAPPLAWHDIDMDDPYAQPHVDVHSDIGKKTFPLDSVVYDAVDGKIPAADLLPAEKCEVLRILHRRGWSDRRIAAWLHWHEDLDNGADNVCKYREREGITGFGMAMTGDPGLEAKQGLILWGAAA